MQMESNPQGTTDFSNSKNKRENSNKTLIFSCEKTLIWTAVSKTRKFGPNQASVTGSSAARTDGGLYYFLRGRYLGDSRWTQWMA